MRSRHSNCNEVITQFGCVDVAGDWQMGPKVAPLDPTSVKSVVQYGTTSEKYTMSSNGTAEVYSQLYPFNNVLNYTSGIIHHVRITGNYNHFL